MKDFINYIQTLDIAIEEQELLSDDSLLEEHWLYINLVPLLTGSQNNLSPALKSLRFSSYLYFRGLLAFDALMDSNGSPEEKKLSLFTFFNFQEKSIRCLARLFPENAAFWAYFEKCKARYIKINVVEKELSATKRPVSEKEFEWLAAEKSAVCDAIVYALTGLGALPTASQALHLDCLKLLHIGFQYQDDIDDFKKDIAEDQWTYARYLVESLIEKEGVKDPPSDDYKYRYLFVSGIAQRLLTKASDNFTQSLEIANQLGLSGLSEFIHSQKVKCTIQIEEIALLIEKTKIKASLSADLKVLSTTHAEKNLLKDVKGHALHFIQEHLKSDGYWQDFLTHAGFGKEWVTAYTALNLTEASIDLPVLDIITENIKQSGGAYNESMIRDADSLSFYIGYLKQRGHSVPEDMLNTWLEFLHNTGGWSTYNNDNQLRKTLNLDPQLSTEGWLMPHNCVTATACYMLSFFEELEPTYHKTAKYLTDNIEEAGYIRPYWWTSPFYSTAYGILALCQSTEYEKACKKMADWIESQQTERGCWDNSALKIPSAFYTALAIKALMIFDFENYQPAIKKGVKWLLQHQTTDGSWISNCILLLPATDITDIGSVEHWRKSSFGVNVVIDDHHRIFTTATVLNALEIYSKINVTTNVG